MQNSDQDQKLIHQRYRNVNLNQILEIILFSPLKFPMGFF